MELSKYDQENLRLKIDEWKKENPKSFFSSAAEIAAIKKTFPNTHVYICEFHREQAWERWVKKKKHGLSEVQAHTLLDLLRDCANAPPIIELWRVKL